MDDKKKIEQLEHRLSKVKQEIQRMSKPYDNPNNSDVARNIARDCIQTCERLLRFYL